MTDEVLVDETTRRLHGRIRRDHRGMWEAVHLEWDETRWPAEAWVVDEETGFSKGDFLEGGDAWEVHLGNYKSDYQAREAVERAARSL